jgi:hypothetical protein
MTVPSRSDAAQVLTIPPPEGGTPNTATRGNSEFGVPPLGGSTFAKRKLPAVLQAPLGPPIRTRPSTPTACSEAGFAWIPQHGPAPASFALSGRQ